MSKNRARDRAARAHMETTGAFRARAARTVDTTAGAEPFTLGTTVFLLDASIPVGIDHGLADAATMEQLFAALVARSAVFVERDGVPYGAYFEVHVVPPAGSRPGDAPDGWRNAAAIVYVVARRPWDLDDELDHVVTDAYRAIRDTLHRHWPGLPEEDDHAALPWHLLASLRGRLTEEGAQDLLREMQEKAICSSRTIGADEEVDPANW
ncbi:hypothetical protein ABT224_20375 [Streptomyces sp. NPDC001584]|uniref:hypothetical protein n=1 Tax=Streptomyces sp. NPDC001584 TaxID=3154521 RepID=UPI0033191265